MNDCIKMIGYNTGVDAHYNMLGITTTNLGYTYVWTFKCPLCMLLDNKNC